MNKKRIISYVMAAALLVGGTFAGTKALFTDVVDAAGEISISTGDVDLKEEVVKPWTLVRNGDEINMSSDGTKAIFDNLKTGDIITKEVLVKNVGTLDALVEFDGNEEVLKNLPEGIEYTAVATMKQGGVLGHAPIPMKPSNVVKIQLEIKVTGGGKHNEEGSLNSDDQERTKIDLRNSYILKATQKNPNGVK